MPLVGVHNRTAAAYLSGHEQLWADVLQMQPAIAKVSPATAWSVGLKVAVDASVHASRRSSDIN
jgi:hypothetical protein